MKQYLLITSLTVLLVACGDKAQAPAANTASSATAPVATQAAVPAAAPAAVPDKEALVGQAKAAAQALGGTLKQELEAAMQAGGPIAALGVCNTKAPEIAKAVSAEKGVAVSRVSLKPRNPTQGVPAEWQAKVLHDFEARKVAGEPADGLAYAEVVGNEFRFMKAIPTGGVCLACHGETLSPDVSAKLKELYPNDLATGFKEGDLRGAFVVVKNLAP